jgi:hypothetical protein
MRVLFRAIHPIFGRATKPLSLSYQQRSPYYWWWEFLRRNESYAACCAAGGAGELAVLYKNFGNVSGDSFKQWWTEGNRGFHLFSEKPMPLKLKELEAASDWDSTWTKDAVMVVAVPLSQPKRNLQSWFAALVKTRHKGERGRKALSDSDASTAAYPLHRNVSIHTLRVQLAVYDAVMANRAAEKKRTLAQIGADLKLVVSAIPKANDEVEDATHKRNVMSATVSRHFKDAQRIVANTAKGQFPNSK